MMTFMEFVLTDLDVRDWISGALIILAVALIIALVITMDLDKLLEYTLETLAVTIVLGYGTYTYHAINYDMYKAELCISEGDYNSALDIYEELLDVYPELPRVVDAYDKCKEVINLN